MRVFIDVGEPGIEPGLNGPKPLVLPLYYSPVLGDGKPLAIPPRCVSCQYFQTIGNSTCFVWHRQCRVQDEYIGDK